MHLVATTEPMSHSVALEPLQVLPVKGGESRLSRLSRLSPVWGAQLPDDWDDDWDESEYLRYLLVVPFPTGLALLTKNLGVSGIAAPVGAWEYK